MNKMAKSSWLGPSGFKMLQCFWQNAFILMCCSNH